MNGILYTVATPIGNLEDMSPRAIKTLESVDYILCEDTRVSSKLLSKFNISKKLIAYHKFNEKEQVDKVLADLRNGQNIALISDAGTPCVSDPGRVLVNDAYKEGFKVIPVSGACAVSTFLSAVPKEDETYIFTGFIPRTFSEQQKFFEENYCADLVFYESPNRILKTLENIIKIYGNSVRVAVGRELTKLYEEILSDTAENIYNHFKMNQPKGEFVVMLYKEKNNDKTNLETEIEKKVVILKNKGYSSKDVSVILSLLFDVNKNLIYKIASEK